MQLGLACMFLIRNSSAHDPGELTERDALEQLATLSRFVRLAESCAVTNVQ